MIVDSSAIVAIVLQEPGHEHLRTKLTRPDVTAGIGTPTVTEIGLVISGRRNQDSRAVIADLLAEFEIETVPFTDAHWRAATGAFWRYGRGRHRAALNFGDCMTYAVASLAAEPLLFVGEDFTHTDLRAA